VTARALLLVLDGTGVGAMPDAPVGERAAHTVASVLAAAAPALPALRALGLGRLLPQPEPVPPGARAGRVALAHAGADTYLGHNELLGALPPPPRPARVREVADRLCAALAAAGFAPEPIAGGGALWLEPGLVVADNLEARPGNAVNLSGSLDAMPFADMERAAAAVRAALAVSRVIVLGAPGIDPRHLRDAVVRRGDETGIATARAGLYREGYVVRHLGLALDGRSQLPSRVAAAGGAVRLVGKVADLAAPTPPAVVRTPAVDTASVLAAVDGAWAQVAGPGGLVCATVQETDLAGHAEDAHRFARVLAQVDAWLGARLDRLGPEDLVVVTADHGNDPRLGSGHTREYAPVLCAGAPACLPGEGDGLTAVGAMVARHLALPARTPSAAGAGQ